MDDQRLIESESSAQIGNVLRRCVRPKHDGGRIAGRHTNDHEYDRYDQKHDDSHADKPLKDVAHHAIRFSRLNHSANADRKDGIRLAGSYFFNEAFQK
ncbi:hypothetical protein D3C80_1832580 [compost metagenome]